jgi:hypothetical protein
MSQLFKSFCLLVLAAWAVGAFVMKLDNAVHLFLVIGIYAMALLYTSEFKRKKKQVPARQFLLTAVAESIVTTESIAATGGDALVQDIACEVMEPIILSMESPVAESILNEVADTEVIPQPTRCAHRWWSHLKVACHLQLPDSIQLDAKVAFKHAQGSDLQSWSIPTSKTGFVNWYWVTNHPSSRLGVELKSGHIARNPMVIARCTQKMSSFPEAPAQEITWPLFIPILA